MDTLSRLTAPATATFRQLQKMVLGVKKNDSGGFLDKLRRLKSKPCPKVPARDYQGDDVDSDEEWSGAEFESDTYEDPMDDMDDYEPPPSHNVFTPTPSNSFQRGEYVDSCRHKPSQPPRKPICPAKATKPPPPPEPRPMDDDDDEDYVNPNSDENYIRPMEKPCPNHLMQGRTRAVKTSALASKRVTERTHSSGPSTNSEEDLLVIPETKPRDKSPTPAFRPRPDLKHKESEGPAMHTRHSSQKPSSTVPFMDFKQPKIPLPQLFTSHRQTHRGRAAENGSPPDTEKEADLSQKPWYASACDRKTAEDTLIRSDKDGSFLVRKSSGQNSRQPYTLVVFYNSRVYNIPVRYIPRSQQYALGREKEGEELFSSVSHIIENHQWSPLVLIDGQSNTKDATKLCYPVRP